MPRLVRHAPISAMTCREVVELVTAYLEGALDAPTRLRFEQHVTVCAGCQVYVEQIRTTIVDLGDVTLPDLPDDVCAELVEVFRARPSHRDPAP